MIECVANVSEGHDARVLAALTEACRHSLLDLHVDTDHHRSVFTLAGPGAHDAEGAARRLADAVARHVSIVGHEGVHPRLGALDVVPFVALDTAVGTDYPDDGTDGEDSYGVAGIDSRHGSGVPHTTVNERRPAVYGAIAFARWWSDAFEVPVFFYGDAAPDSVTLPQVRREAFRSRAPDLGPPAPHPTLGATAVGARPPLVAVNCELTSPDLDTARRVASAVRESGGGLSGVRALGLPLESVGLVQVSMNLVDLASTGLEAAVLRVRGLARAEGGDVARVELVGLLPGAELDRCSDEFLAWADLDATVTIEARVAALAHHVGGPPG